MLIFIHVFNVYTAAHSPTTLSLASFTYILVYTLTSDYSWQKCVKQLVHFYKYQVDFSTPPCPLAMPQLEHKENDPHLTSAQFRYSVFTTTPHIG